MMTYPGYDYGPNLSKLHRAWEKYYDDMGLAAMKKLSKVCERVRRGKFPPVK